MWFQRIGRNRFCPDHPIHSNETRHARTSARFNRELDLSARTTSTDRPNTICLVSGSCRDRRQHRRGWGPDCPHVTCAFTGDWKTADTDQYPLPAIKARSQTSTLSLRKRRCWNRPNRSDRCLCRKLPDNFCTARHSSRSYIAGHRYSGRGSAGD